MLIYPPIDGGHHDAIDPHGGVFVIHELIASAYSPEQNSLNDIGMKRFFWIGLMTVGLSTQAQLLINKWDFNAANLSPSTGSGTLSLLGGTTATFAGGFDDENVGWRTANYPSQGLGNLSAGIQMQISTAGKSGISLSYAARHGMESANRQSVLWSTDNSTYQPAQVFTVVPAANGSADTWFTRTVSLPSGADNQPNLYIRIVSNFTPGLSAYTATAFGSTYSGSGPWRFDDISFSAVPEPATSAAMAGAALVAFALLRKRLAGKGH